VLSHQERTVARLAATGATNGQIGQQLGLSPRTVGSHLTRVFEKLRATLEPAHDDSRVLLLLLRPFQAEENRRKSTSVARDKDTRRRTLADTGNGAQSERQAPAEKLSCMQQLEEVHRDLQALTVATYDEARRMPRLEFTPSPQASKSMPSRRSAVIDFGLPAPVDFGGTFRQKYVTEERSSQKQSHAVTVGEPFQVSVMLPLPVDLGIAFVQLPEVVGAGRIGVHSVWGMQWQQVGGHVGVQPASPWAWYACLSSYCCLAGGGGGWLRPFGCERCGCNQGFPVGNHATALGPECCCWC
jgi:DNA-binding transcriptional ArsR family regulator